MYKNRNFKTSLSCAFNGIKEVFKSERNFRIDTYISILVFLGSIYFQISLIEVILILFSIFFVMIMEIFNTLLENILDFYTLEYNNKIKIIKDISAGLVVLTSAFAIIIGLVVFIPKILRIVRIYGNI